METYLGIHINENTLIFADYLANAREEEFTRKMAEKGVYLAPSKEILCG
jgi:hypothetical protein